MRFMKSKHQQRIPQDHPEGAWVRSPAGFGSFRDGYFIGPLGHRYIRVYGIRMLILVHRRKVSADNCGCPTMRI